MEIEKILLELLTVGIAATSLVMSITTHIQTKKSEKIKNLLSEKESVGFGAIKLLNEGFPKRKGKERTEIITAIVLASLFEGSDRARALLFAVINLKRKECYDELEAEIKKIDKYFCDLEKKQFDPKQLDLSSGKLRLAAIQKLIAKETSS